MLMPARSAGIRCVAVVPSAIIDLDVRPTFGAQRRPTASCRRSPLEAVVLSLCLLSDDSSPLGGWAGKTQQVIWQRNVAAGVLISAYG